MLHGWPWVLCSWTSCKSQRVLTCAFWILVKVILCLAVGISQESGLLDLYSNKPGTTDSCLIHHPSNHPFTLLHLVVINYCDSVARSGSGIFKRDWASFFIVLSHSARSVCTFILAHGFLLSSDIKARHAWSYLVTLQHLISSRHTCNNLL